MYILASRPNGTLYVGVTSDLIRRIWQHKTGETTGFTQTYGVKTLVYFELHATMPDAILREKQIKQWRRAWKLDLIRCGNPTWRDLYDEILGRAPPDGFPLSRE
ncbi:MAG TPA: GIY-YIG nuclease family protein [Acetobacteraceae bacterium]